MADQSSPFQFEDVPLDEARRLGRGPRMEPMLYETLRTKIQSLSTDAVRIHLGPEITQQRMRNYLLHIARELGIPVTVRRVSGGLLFWRSSDEDIQQAKEVGARLQTARQPQPPPQTRPRGRRPRGNPLSVNNQHAGHQRPSGGNELYALSAESVLRSSLSSSEVPGVPEELLCYFGTRLWCAKLKENYRFSFT